MTLRRGRRSDVTGDGGASRLVPTPHPHLVDHMPFLTSDHGRHELTPGNHILGGREERSVPIKGLKEMPAAAAITVSPPGAPVIRRLAPGVVKINGRHLGK